MKIRYFLRLGTYGHSIEVRIAHLNADGEVVGEAKPLTFQAVEDGALWREPAMTLRQCDAQSLMDELWQLGFRPERGNITTGQIAATEKHLNDMRAMVGKLANVDFPK